MKRGKRIKLGLRRVLARAVVYGPLTFLLVAGAGCPSLFESTTQRVTKLKQAVPGKDLAGNVTNPNTVVNVYAQLAGTADPIAGDKTITVADVNANFLSAVGPGDLLLIVQMAGATVDFTTNNSSAYGAFTTTDLGSAGRYELVGVHGVAANVITLACGLKNGYSRAGKTQVIRVPQYTTLSIGAGASISAPAWNGTTGGVVAVHAESTVTLTGNIDVSAKGFRGGYHGGDNVVDNSSGAATTAGTGVTLYRSATAADGAEKGEGVAGYQADYTNGRYGRGAVANAGGGGNSHNAGGGGGANASSGAAWSGQGVMLGTYATDPWIQDPGYTANGGARTTSEGGGRGGYTYSSLNLDALTNGPGLATWGGDARRDVGGLGGRPVPNATSGAQARLFLGGGGGAGDGNNNATYGSSRGGNGGGLVFLIAGSIAGAGSILANGETAPDATYVAGGGDSAGGGGGGGTVVINATSLSAVAIAADGGGGGNQVGSSGQNEAEGPGGGGGGGYIAVAGSGTPTLSATGGLGGTTDRGALSEFPSNGATAGNTGVTNGDASSFIYCGGVVTTIGNKPANPSNVTTATTFTFTNTASPVTYECKLDTPAGPGTRDFCNASNHSTPSFTTPTLTVDGTYVLSVWATDAYGNVESPPATYTWILDTTPPDTSFAAKPGNPSGDSTGDFTFASTEPPSTYECKLDTPAGPGSWALCNAGTPTSTSYTTPTLTEGSQTLSVRAIDAAGNTDLSPATYTWVYSASLPATTIDTKPANPTKVTTGNFTFTNSKSPVTYECKLDTPGGAGTWAPCNAGDPSTPGYTTGTLTDGTYTLSVKSTFAGSVVEDPPVTYTWLVDTVAPDTSIVDKPANPSAVPISTFTFGSTESAVTYECKLDTPAGGAGTWTACHSSDHTVASFTTPFLADGDYTLSVRATDAAGNVDLSPATYAWAVNGGALDAGVLDAQASETGTVVADTAPVVIVDAERLDAERLDAEGVDLGVAIDLGVKPDLGAVDSATADAAADVLPASGPEPGPEPAPDTAPASGPEPGPDTAPGPEPSPDTAVPVNEDAAPPANADAGHRVLGGGFCAISPAPSPSPAGFLVLALAGLALLRRRRR